MAQIHDLGPRVWAHLKILKMPGQALQNNVLFVCSLSFLQATHAISRRPGRRGRPSCTGPPHGFAWLRGGRAPQHERGPGGARAALRVAPMLRTRRLVRRSFFGHRSGTYHTVPKRNALLTGMDHEKKLWYGSKYQKSYIYKIYDQSVSTSQGLWPSTTLLGPLAFRGP